MLTIICGEDIISSRNYFFLLKKQYAEKGYEIREILPNDIEKLLSRLAESVSLFFDRKIFVAENLNKQIKKENKRLLEELKRIEKNKDLELIVWENLSARELKIAKLGKVKEFKPNQTIFKLLESLYPGNKTSFIIKLNSLTKDLDETFVFIMLARHVRNLILVKIGEIPNRMQSWQLYKIKNQLKNWKMENLINFYQSLYRIEFGSKTGSTPFSIKESLEILSCHFL